MTNSSGTEAVTVAEKPSLFKNKKLVSVFSNFIFPLVLAIVILFSSGYAKTTTRQGSFNTVVLAVLAVLTVIFVVAAIIKSPVEFYSRLRHPIKNKVFKNSTLYLAGVPLLIFVAFLIVYFINGNELFTILHYVLLMVFGFSVAMCVSLKTFAKYYNKTMLFVAIFSLIVFIMMLSAGKTKFYSSTFISGNEAYYRSFLGLYFRIDVGNPRNYGPFWEPGIFSLMLFVGLILEILCNKRINFVIITIFVLTIISTFSTSAIILLPFCFPFYFAVHKKKIGFWISLPVAIVFAVGFIVLGEPSLNIPFFSEVFSKLFAGDKASGSFMTRLYSPLYGAYLGGMSYGIGYGPNIFDAKYEVLTLFNQTKPIQQTSTVGWLIGSFGVIGMLFAISSLFYMFFFYKERYNIKTAILGTIFAFVIINCEPMYAFSIFWIIFMYPFAYNIRCAQEELGYKTSLSEVVSKSQLGTKLTISNLSWSLIIKVVALAVGLLLYPQYVKFFGNQTTFIGAGGEESTIGAVALGTWLVILQILSWILTFDIGIGNGLKNKIVEAINEGRREDVKKYISCSYISNFVIIAVLLAAGLPVIFNLNFNKFLNVSEAVIPMRTLQLAFALAFISICLEFFLKIVLNIYQALQKQVVASVVPLISTILLIIFVFFVRFESMSTSLIAISLFYIFSINVPLIIVTIILFSTEFKDSKPSLKLWSFPVARSVVAIGGIYFLIQIFLLVINSTNKIIISNVYGAEHVATYEPYLKIFSAICAVASAISLPVWTLVLRADVRKDYAWIKKMEKVMSIIGLVFAVGSIVAAASLQIIFDIWLDSKSFPVGYYKAFMFAAWAIASIASYFVSAFSNGLKVLKPQVIILGIFAIIKVPLFILLHYLFKELNWIVLLMIDTGLLGSFSIMMFIFNKIVIKKRIAKAEAELTTTQKS